MSDEIQFTKYQTKGADYHYDQINKHKLNSFNAYVYARYQQLLNHINNYLRDNFKDRQIIRILDLGCGDGVLLNLINDKLKKFKLELFGIDRSAEALSVARKKIKSCSFYNKDVYDTSFNDEFFDLIISADVIEHVKYPEKMLNEISRIAKRNSTIIIGTPIKYTQQPLDSMHYQEFYQNDFKKILSKHFSIKQLTESHSLLYLLLYQKQITIFGKDIFPFKYLINISSIILGINPYMFKGKNQDHLNTYMTAICKK